MKGRRGKGRLWYRGSFTVEASFVVPILLGILFVILYLLFLFHDRILVQENGCEALYSMAEGALPASRDSMRAKVEEGLWVLQVKKVKVSKTHKAIRGTVEAQARWNIPIMTFFLNGLQEISWSQEVSCTHPEEVMRWKK